MTWQRIDENTYIDDTLVTCAEYQLFIDEMREQGKYYQPGHWSSYQFPEGQALAPILGVRFDDAVDFCNWLTQRENGKWQYVLPAYEEATTDPIIGTNLKEIGYWAFRSSSHSNNFISLSSDSSENDSISRRGIFMVDKIVYSVNGFVWVGKRPKEPRGISHIMLRTFDLDRTRALELRIERENMVSLIAAVNNSISNLYFNRIYTEYFHDRELIQDRQLNINNQLAQEYDKIISAARNLDRKKNLKEALENYSDLITLQERIAGRSPAFEGIRLVKERIR